MKNLSIAFLAAMSLASFGCKKKGADGGGYTAAMDDFATKMCACKDKACADGVSTDMAKWSTEYASKPGAAKVSADDGAKVAAAGQKLADCMTKIATDSAMAAVPAAGSDTMMAGSAAPAAGSDTAPAAAGSATAVVAPAAAGDLPQECLDYKAATEKFAACDKAPQASRDAMKTTFDSASAGWAAAAATPEGKTAVVTSCKAATDALAQAATAVGCN